MSVFSAVRHLTIASLTFLALSSAEAQIGEGVSIPDLMKIRPQVRPEESAIAARAVPMDGPVVPAEYFMGPNDVVSLNVWSSSPVSHQLTVTPEGTLLIPNVGAVQVADISLEAAKARVGDAVSRRYPNAEISLTLLTPRRVIVRIVGQVLNEAKHEMSAVDRVDRLIQTANTIAPSEMNESYFQTVLPRLRGAASERTIVVQHRDGTTTPVDLVKYRTSGKGIYNPYLREGDVVLVPGRTSYDNSLGVFGAVRQPGSYEFVPGDSLTDLLQMGFGLEPKARPEEAVLTRLGRDGLSMDKATINVRSILDGTMPNVALQPGDKLVVPAEPEERQNYIASVEGEVVRPGIYPITRNKTRLSEIIAMAGGFTGNAYIRGATLTRARLTAGDAPDQVEFERLLSVRTSLGSDDSSYYLTETALRIRGEVVSVDFHRLFVAGDSTQDVELHTFDRIIIPEKRRSVYVFGQVLTPGHVEYVQGRDYLFYVGKARGFTKDARQGDVKIIKGTTRAWLDPDETTVEDGDYIWVPKEPSRTLSYYMTIYGQVAGIVGAAATVALLVYNITR